MSESKDKYIKKRRRVQGKHSGMCSTFIAKLAGVAPVTARRFLKGLGRPAQFSDIRRFIFEQECRRLTQEIKSNLGIDLTDRLASLLSRGEFK